MSRGFIYCIIIIIIIMYLVREVYYVILLTFFSQQKIISNTLKFFFFGLGVSVVCSVCHHMQTYDYYMEQPFIYISADQKLLSS